MRKANFGVWPRSPAEKFRDEKVLLKERAFSVTSREEKGGRGRRPRQ